MLAHNYQRFLLYGRLIHVKHEDWCWRNHNSIQNFMTCIILSKGKKKHYLTGVTLLCRHVPKEVLLTELIKVRGIHHVQKCTCVHAGKLWSKLIVILTWQCRSAKMHIIIFYCILCTISSTTFVKFFGENSA